MRESYVPYSDFKFDEEYGWWIFPFDNRVIKSKSWTELPSPPKPASILISVVIINWDRPLNVVESSVESVLNQDFPQENFEVILVDDASERISPKPSCLKIVQNYPNHNFRAYLLERTRCYQDSHVYNVGFKRALGWIIVMLHSDGVFDDTPDRTLDDTYPGQPFLEGVWRHHNAMEKIVVCPRYLVAAGDGLHQPSETFDYGGWSSFPHDLGLSFRKEYAETIRGVDESKYSDAPLLDLRCRLGNLGIVFTEDLNMQVIHRDYMLPENVYGDPEVVRCRPPDYVFPDWPNNWGELSQSEVENSIMSEAMAKRLKI